MKTQEVIAWDKAYVMQTGVRAPVAIDRGQGAVVWDVEGKTYLDFVAGISTNNTGHCHPKVVAALQAQLPKLMHCSNNFYIEPQVKLAKILTGLAGFDKVFFANTGAEAVEGALKLARKYAKKQWGEEKYEIIAATDSFHGRTLGALAATGMPKYHKGFTPLPAGFKHVPFNDLGAVEQAITPQTAAVLVEPIQGEGGINVPDDDYLPGLRALCDAKQIVLVFDEVQCGMGRTGKMFAHQHYGIKPDIMSLAKALGGGFPIGAFLADEKIASAWERGDHGTTFGGNPLACVAAMAVLEVMEEEDLVNRAAVLGDYLLGKLRELQQKHACIASVQGKGLLVGVRLNTDPQPVVDACQDNGLLVSTVLHKTIRLAPPLVINQDQLDQALDILDQVLARTGER